MSVLVPDIVKAELVKVTSAALWTQDDSRVRLPKICREAQTTTMSVYRFFGSREGLIHEAYLSIFNQLNQESLDSWQNTLQKVSDVSGVLARIRNALDNEEHLRAFVESRGMRLRIAGVALTNKKFSRSVLVLYNDYLDDFGALLDRARQEGRLSRNAPGQRIAREIGNVWMGGMFAALDEQPGLNRDWLETLERILSDPMGQ